MRIRKPMNNHMADEGIASNEKNAKINNRYGCGRSSIADAGSLFVALKGQSA